MNGMNVGAVLYPCQDHFLRVLPLHQVTVKTGTLGRIRTDTKLLLRQSPLPIALRGHLLDMWTFWIEGI